MNRRKQKLTWHTVTPNIENNRNAVNNSNDQKRLTNKNSLQSRDEESRYNLFEYRGPLSV